MRSKFCLLLAFLLLFGSLMPLGRYGSAVQAASGTVIQNGFEDGLFGSWMPFNCSGGTAQIAVSTDYAATGSSSLQLSGRSGVNCSPSIDLNALLQEGHSYDISFKARLGAGSDQAHVTMKMTNQSNNYDWIIGNQSMNDQGWTTFSKTSYTRPAGTTSLTMYLETAASTADVFIDDVLIVDNTPPDGTEEPGTPPIGEAEFGYKFDGGTTEGWGPRGDGVVVAVSGEQQKSGSYSLKTAGRSSDWHGPTVSVFDKLTKNAKYEVSAFVKLVDAPTTSHSFKISAELDASGSKSWVSVASAAVTTTDWVELKGTFSFNSNLSDISFYIESANAADSYYIDDVHVKMTELPVTSPPVQTDLAKLQEVYNSYFKIGAALEPNQLEGKSRELLDQHFNSVVAENAMKPGSINSIKGTYNFESADRLAKFARDNKVNMRFHTLVWHQQAADWMFLADDGSALSPSAENKELVIQRLKDYLGVVVPRYADVATDWDVVNEVIDEGRPNGMRDSLWYQLTGEDFIKVAFTETRRLLDEMYAQDPVKYAMAKDSKLFINDYGTHNPQKAKFLLSLVTRLKEEGVPIDGVGHQTHINISGPSIQQISDSIKMFGEAGFDNQLTEFDVSAYTNNTDAYQDVPQELLAKQGYRYKELFDELKRLDDTGRTADNPEGWISNVTFWGIADDHTWLHNRPVTRQDAPFAFDKNYQAKPAYWGMVDPSKLTAVKKTANAVHGSPSLSGMDDLVWNTVPVIPLEKSGVLEAGMKLLWDEDQLYVKAIVTDPSKLSGDKVDLFVKDGSAIKSVQVVRGTAGSVETDNGYTIVAAIPLTGSTAGSKASFDIRVTDAGSDDGTEHGKNGSIISWSDLGNSQEANSNGYGELTLIPGTQISNANYGTPILDGELDAIWANANKLDTAVKVEGGEGSKAEFYTMWDDEHLYVYAMVTDKKLSAASANPWEHDSIEIFLDQNNGKTSSYDADDGQYRINFENVRTVGGHASHDNYNAVTKSVYGPGDIATGYIVEAAVDLDMIAPRNGTVIGFDLQVNNDDNGTGKRDSVWMWNDPTGKSYENTSRLGVMVLGGKPNDGGSTGSTGGSGSTGSIPQAKPGELNVTVDANGNAKASISASDLNKALSGSKLGLLKFHANGADKAEQLSIAISADLADAAKLAGIKIIEISSGIASVQLPVSLFEGAGSSDTIELNISKIAAEALSDVIRAKVGSNTVYDFKLTVGGKTISQFGEGVSVGISMPYVLEKGENRNQIVVWYVSDDGKLEVIQNGKYNAITGMVEFATTHFSQFAAVFIDVRFNDAASIAWANDSIRGLAARGIVNGISEQVFAPGRAVTRAEFIQMLMHTLDLEQASASSSFLDVKSGTWYYDAIASAQQLGIVSGLADGTFGINDQISRQEMAAMVYRAMQKSGHILSDVNHKVEFDDAAAIAEYAKEAVVALQAAGIINGMGNGSFAPNNSASRAQAAIILYQLLQQQIN
ncbi:endo-1,4-beta-xylanase [Paenibacillus sp. PL91]|uniref:endo-1,4-beta-xylanase n=1 Tax=Paenibacillus sp. PL91 TaxID=2729538 RepID=UPI00145E77C2|nr:endo-1,4-beta-xylanase [Paenibacillus sp. PL91]MBC9201366.1 endo-1,4-beta-xylanase [Paenibacillus sp. PL91]